MLVLEKVHALTEIIINVTKSLIYSKINRNIQKNERKRIKKALLVFVMLQNTVVFEFIHLNLRILQACTLVFDVIRQSRCS